MDKKNIYKDDSIKSLSPLEFVRLRPGVYCGSTDYSTQLLRELFANALDEHNIGHGDLIEISINTKENIYTVTDHGQGFPFNLPTQEGRTILEDSFSILNTSGKYDDDGIYGASAIGLNGIGCKLATYLSLWLNVSSSIGDGTSENLQFKDGVFVKRELKRGIARKSGTSIQYKPDPQFFKDEAVNLTEIRKLFKETSALCPKLTIKLNIDGKEEVYHSVNGLNDLVDDITKKKEIVKNRFVTRLKDGDSLFDCLC